MPTSARFGLVLVLLSVVGIGTGASQQVQELPTPLVPLRALTQEEINQREALKLYALGLLHERGERIHDALAAYHKSLQLDPKAAAVYKATVPLLLALERLEDALAATRKVLDLEPQDYRAWYLYSRQLRAKGQLKEACEALRRAADCPAAKDTDEALHQIHFDLGQLHERLSEVPQAIAAYARAAEILDLHTEHHLDIPEEMLARIAETYERVGRLHLHMKQPDRALDAFRAAQRKHPLAAARLSLDLAQLCTQQGHHDEALTYLDAYLRLQPQGTDAYELKIDLLRRLNRERDIVPWLRQATENDRFNVRLKLLLARECGHTRGLEEEAERIYLDLANLSPTAEIYQGLFALYRADPKDGLVKVLVRLDTTLAGAANRDNPRAQAVFAMQSTAMIAALRDEPELSKELPRYAGTLLEQGMRLSQPTLHLLAIAAERERNYDLSARFYRLGLADAGEAARTIQIGGLLRVLARGRKDAEVVEVCREALRNEQDPNRVVYMAELTRALARLERFDEAVREADNALRVASDPEKLAVELLRTRVLILAEQFDRAEAECFRLLKSHTLPSEVMEIRYLLSGVYSAARHYDKAEEQLEQCLKLDPGNATLNNDLGYIWADRNKNLDRAEAMIRKAIETFRHQKKGLPGADVAAEENAAFLDSLGWVLFRKGDLAGARRELERAARLPDGEDPTIWEHLGDLYRRLNLPDEAKQAWQRALYFYRQRPRGTMNPRYHEVSEKLRLLGGTETPPPEVRPRGQLRSHFKVGQARRLPYL